METYLDISKEQYQAFEKLPIDGYLRMLNLLKFKEQVSETGKTGAETYKEYMQATAPFFAAANATVAYLGTPLFSLIGPKELEWDKILIAEYPSKQAFMTMINAEGYPAHLRKMALADSRLIFCQ